MKTDVPNFKAVVNKNNDKGYKLCTYKHELRTSKTGKTYYAQTARKKIGEIMGGGKDGLIVFTEEFLEQNPDLRNYRVYRQGSSNIFEKINPEEGEDATPIKVTNVKGLQPHRKLEGPNLEVPSNFSEIVRDKHDKYVIVKKDESFSNSLSNDTYNLITPDNNSSAVARKSTSSACKVLKNIDSTLLPKLHDRSDEDDSSNSTISYETIDRRSFGASYVVCKIYDELGIEDCLLQAGFTKSTAKN